MTEEWLHSCPFSVGSRRGVWGPSSPRPWERALSKPTRSEDWISHPCLELPSQNHEDSKDCYWERTWCNSAVPQVGQGCLCFGIFHLPYGVRRQSDSMSQLYEEGREDAGHSVTETARCSLRGWLIKDSLHCPHLTSQNCSGKRAVSIICFSLFTHTDTHARTHTACYCQVENFKINSLVQKYWQFIVSWSQGEKGGDELGGQGRFLFSGASREAKGGLLRSCIWLPQFCAVTMDSLEMLLELKHLRMWENS